MCLFHRAKSICLSMILCINEVKNLQNMFLHNGDSKHFCDDVIVKEFAVVDGPQPSNKSVKHFGKLLHKFDCIVAKLI